MSEYDRLSILWAKWNGQKGTAKQIAQIQRQLSVQDLRRMLLERGVVLEQGA